MLFSHNPIVFDAGGGAVSPGVADLIAAYDFDDTSGTGQNDSHASFNLTENGTSTWDTGTPNTYNGPTSADYLSSSGLSLNWASSDQDWCMVQRSEQPAVNRNPYFGGGSRESTRWSGSAWFGKIGAGSEATVTPVGSYSGVMVTVIVEYTSSSSETVIRFLNENLVSSAASSNSDFNSSEARIGANNGDGGVIDFMYFFDRKLTSDEILFFGDNSSIARVYGDL